MGFDLNTAPHSHTVTMDVGSGVFVRFLNELIIIASGMAVTKVSCAATTAATKV